MIAAKVVAIVPQREPQKGEARTGFAHLDDTRFLAVDRQSKSPFEHSFDPAGQLSGLVSCQNHEVVGVPHYLGVRPRAGSVAAAELFLEPMQVNVSKKRANYPSLRRPLLGSRHFRPAAVVRLNNGAF